MNYRNAEPDHPVYQSMPACVDLVIAMSYQNSPSTFKLVHSASSEDDRAQTREATVYAPSTIILTATCHQELVQINSVLSSILCTIIIA